MRKQIPILQEMESVTGGGSTMTFGDTYYQFHKNGFLDVYKDEQDQSQRIYLVKRWGLDVNSQLVPTPIPAVNSIVAAGCLAPDGTKNTFIVYTDGTLANTIFSYNGAIAARPAGWALSGIGVGVDGAGAHDLIPLASTSTSSTYGGYYWALSSYNTGAVVSSAGVVTQIVDADYTAWTKKSNIVALDGYLFQADTDSGYIYNSDLNTPTSWTATGRILAASYPGIIVRLMRVRNFLVAFKTSSLEFYQNDGNPTPGSPLSAVPQLTQKYGCSSPHLITEVSDGIIFAGFDPAGVVGIYKLNFSSLTIESIGNSWMAQSLEFQAALGGPFHLTDARPTTYWRTLVIPIRDKELITFPLPIGGGTATFVYDNKLKSWGMWAAWNPVTATENGFPSYCILRRASGPSAQEILVANISDYKFSRLSSSFGGDFTTHSIDYKWVSSYFDFGTGRRKYMGSLSVVVGNRISAATNPSIYMFYRDGDTSVTSGTRTVTWSTTSANLNQRIVFRRLGSFVSRSFVIGSNDTVNYTRISAIECDIDMEADDIS